MEYIFIQVIHPPPLRTDVQARPIHITPLLLHIREMLPTLQWEEHRFLIVRSDIDMLIITSQTLPREHIFHFLYLSLYHSYIE